MELQLVVNNLEISNRKSVLTPAKKTTLKCLEVYCQISSIGDPWPPQESKLHINVLNLKVIRQSSVDILKTF